MRFLSHLVDRYELAALVVPAFTAALSGALLPYENLMTSAEPMSAIFPDGPLARAGDPRGIVEGARRRSRPAPEVLWL